MTSTPPHRIIDPHVHLWDPRTTPRQVSPLVKLFGRWPSLVERLARAGHAAATRRLRRGHRLRPRPPTCRPTSGPTSGITTCRASCTSKPTGRRAGVLGPVGETRVARPPRRPAARHRRPRCDRRRRQARGAARRPLGRQRPAPGHPRLVGCAPRRARPLVDRCIAARFRRAPDAGVAALGERQLTFEAWCYSNQLDELGRRSPRTCR